jgi:glycosyltransferase involved in cell wall biosynthesis
MKIAFIGIKGLPAQYGADRVVEAIVQRLASHHEITVYCSSHEISAGSIYPGVRLIRVPCLRGKYSHMTSVDFLAAVHAVFIGNYDLIHVHNIEASFILPILRLHFKVIATAHGKTHSVEKWSPPAKILLRLTEFMFAYWANVRTSVSKSHGLEWEQKYHKEVQYIPNGVDSEPVIDEQAAQRLLDELGINGEGYILFAAGRILPLKGCHLLVEAYQNLKSRNHLVIVGDLTQMPGYVSQLRELAKGNNRIHFVPFVSSKSQLMGLINRATIFVFPSINEAMSMMLLEVASIGTPIICSDIGENSAVMYDHAIYFKSGDSNDLSKKLEWALNNRDLIQEMGKKARDLVQNKYDWISITAQYEKLYQQAINSN